MQIKIYQAYYKPEQQSELDTLFTPYDNSAGGNPSISEYLIYKGIYAKAMEEKCDLWGHFSWQWKTKLEGPKAEDIFAWINNKPGYDVYTFNAFPQEVANQWNVWEQGQWCHPHMMDLAQAILPKMGVSADIIKQSMGIKHYCMANYMVGNQKFWDGFLAFVDKFFEVCETLDEATTAKLNESAEYPYNTGLNYRGFFIERLVSTYLLLNNDNLRIMPYLEHYNNTLNDSAKALIMEKQSDPTSWLTKRIVYTGKHDWAKDWIAQ